MFGWLGCRLGVWRAGWLEVWIVRHSAVAVCAKMNMSLLKSCLLALLNYAQAQVVDFQEMRHPTTDPNTRTLTLKNARQES